MISCNTSCISIIMPAYNVYNFIKAAIQSVLSQTIHPLELIIVNDGSTDDTPEIIESFASHPLVRIFNTTNQGLGPARNLGREMAHGEYIYFFDSDDLLAPDFIERLEECIAEKQLPDMVLFSGKTFIDPPCQLDHQIFGKNYLRKIEGVFTQENKPITTLFRNNSFSPSACLYISKKTLWEKHEIKFQPITHEDEGVILPLLALSRRTAVIKDILFHRRVRENSIMTTPTNLKHVNGYKSICQSLHSFLLSNPKLVQHETKIWIKRIRFFTMRYIILSKEIKQPIDYRFVTKLALQINRLDFYALFLFILLPIKIQQISKHLLLHNKDIKE